MALGEILGIGGGIVNAFASNSANKARKEVDRAQRDILRQQGQTYKQTQPLFLQTQREMANRAGLRDENGVQQTGEGHFNLGGMPGQPQSFGLGGAYGSPELQMRLRAAEEDINKRRTMQANQLRHQLGGAGVAQGSIGAALARNQGAADQQYGSFRRQLAIDQDQEQERRLAQLQQLISMGFGQGSQASAGYAGQSAMYGGQAAAANQGISNIASQYALGQQLRGLGGVGGGQAAPGLGGSGSYDSYTYPGMGGTSPAPWSPMGNQLPWWMQQDLGG